MLVYMSSRTKCVICGDTIIGYGHNPEPVKSEGICCDKCNNDVVLRFRLFNLGLSYTGIRSATNKEDV
ncbi:MAG: hypothetical protein Unbinned805contig1001_14 [Prokaryotic dsDNA virus sp.]|nr:MAG: hypothetical protein Unbinned805contig1001_14 [Prokaryotic dsDNA virus sp.]